MTESTSPIYTSRIIKASALIADTKVLLSEWNLGESVSDNLDRARRQNIFGKASRRRIEDILHIFRQRYFDDADVGTALVTLVQKGAPGPGSIPCPTSLQPKTIALCATWWWRWSVPGTGQATLTCRSRSCCGLSATGPLRVRP